MLLTRIAGPASRRFLPRRTLLASFSASTSPSPSLMSFPTSMSCAGCGPTQVYAPGLEPLFKCPAATPGSEADHVLMPTPPSPSSLASLSAHASSPTSSPSPFLKYRALLYPYRVAISGGMTDERYVEIVTELDDRIKVVNGGKGFEVTPCTYSEEQVSPPSRKC